MCCQMTSECRVKSIAIFSICLSILGAIFGQVNLLMPLERPESNVSGSSMPCEEIVKADCDSSISRNHSQTTQSIHAIMTAFQLVIDLPTSVLLLIAANLKKKHLLVPWMFVTALKMLGYVVGCCVFVHFVLIHWLNEYTGFGVINYYSRTNKTAGEEQHYSIFSGSAVNDVIRNRFFQSCILEIITVI